MLKEIISVYSENYIKSINALGGQCAEFMVKEGGTYIYH
jgi:hypothetical protein